MSEPKVALTVVPGAAPLVASVEEGPDKPPPGTYVLKAPDAILRKAIGALPGSPVGAPPGAEYTPAPAPTAALTEEELSLLFSRVGALPVPYDATQCARLYERSSALRPNVEAYATNIDGFGYHLDPVIDLDKADADERILDAISYERETRGDFTPPTPEEVTAAKEIIRRGMRREKAYIDRFFRNAVAEYSFVELRDRTRKEIEITGNGFWEVIRNAYGEIVGFEHIKAASMRLRAIEPHYHDVQTPQKCSDVAYETVTVKRRFRTYVQIVFGVEAVYFKEFGDARVLSSKRGIFYKSLAELREKEGADAQPANEVLHFAIFSPLSVYGVPRWVGATQSIGGLIFAEIVNTSYFNNKGVPPFVILVSGGRLSDGAEAKIRAYLEEHHKGIENYHSMLILEADSANSAVPTNRVRIELKNLMDAQLSDGLFQVYEANCDKKIARQFRLPDLLRGASQEVNRAQAEAVLQFAEQQVFQPERERFDHLINRRIFADMRVRFWEFRTNSAPSKDPDAMTNIATKWVEAGVLAPGEARPLAGEVFNRDFAPLEDEDWTKRPIAVTIAEAKAAAATPPAGAGPSSGPSKAGGSAPNLDAAAAAGPPAPPPAAKTAASHEEIQLARVAETITALRAQLDAAAAAGHAEAVTTAKRGRLEVVVDKAIIDSWFENDPQP